MTTYTAEPTMPTAPRQPRPGVEHPSDRRPWGDEPGTTYPPVGYTTQGSGYPDPHRTRQEVSYDA